LLNFNSLEGVRKFLERVFDFALVFLSKKSERPVGVPAALAWGMEGLLSEDQFFPGVVGCSTALASSKATHRIKIVRIISTTPEAEPNSRST
jgi:hypothetical protein